jgi:allophanate hydrolase
MAATAPDLSIQALRAAYAAGRAPADLLAEVMQRIASYERKGVWIHVLKPAEIEAQLRGLEKARAAGRPLPLYGVPFAVKDNIDVAGVPTTAACPAYAYVPAASATCVQKLNDAGAIVIGKTNLDQFATGLVGTRSPYGACENALDPHYISGGSSSGSAVAVAGGLCSFALGTDTAGSGRVPAAFNGIVGLKPTRGLISAAGVVPACRSLDCVSIFTISCQDAQAVFDVAAGPDAADPLSRVAPPRQLPPPGGPFRVGIPDQLDFFGNRAAEALFNRAVEWVRQTGAVVTPLDFTPFKQAGDLLYDGPWVAERLLAAGQLFRESPGKLRPELRSILQGAGKYTAPDVFDGLHRLAALRKQADAQLARVHVFLAPTAGTIYRIAEVEADPMALNRNLGRYTTFVNLLDLCALAVPGGFLPSGLPFGVTFMAPAFMEHHCLPVASRFHQHILSEHAS